MRYFILQSLSHSTNSIFYIVTATTETYTLSLHDALPILPTGTESGAGEPGRRVEPLPRLDLHLVSPGAAAGLSGIRSEEHTSELQSQFHLVCRILFEKKN